MNTIRTDKIRTDRGIGGHRLGAAMGQVSVSAEICAYTEQRSRETLDAVASVRQQNRAVIHHLASSSTKSVPTHPLHVTML
jgi:hypothetical protein